MDNKGFNQIDLAVAVGLMLGLMSFVVIYTNSLIVPQISEAQSAELRSTAKILADIAFADRGIPPDWPYKEPVRPSLMEYVYVTPVHVVEYNNTNWNNVVVSVNLTVDEHAYNRSIRVYEGNVSLDTNLMDSGDNDGDGLLEWMNVSFRFNIGGREKKLFHVYYSQDNTTQATYVLLTQTANTTFNVTVLGEGRINGLTPLKLGRINGLNATYLRPRYGVRRSFRIEVTNVTGPTYAAGDILPLASGIAVNERRVISQNATGHINIVKATVWVW